MSAAKVPVCSSKFPCPLHATCKLIRLCVAGGWSCIAICWSERLGLEEAAKSVNTKWPNFPRCPLQMRNGKWNWDLARAATTALGCCTGWYTWRGSLILGEPLHTNTMCIYTFGYTVIHTFCWDIIYLYMLLIPVASCSCMSIQIQHRLILNYILYIILLYTMRKAQAVDSCPYI